MSRPGGIGVALAAVLAALVFASTAFASTYESGAQEPTPSQVCPFYPGQSKLETAGYSTLSYLGDPDPVTNQVYYIQLAYQVNGYTQLKTASDYYGCAPYEDVSMEIGLPEHTSLDVSAQNPILCSDDSGPFTYLCPTVGQTGTGSDGVKTDPGYFRFDPDEGNEVWKVSTGDTLDIAIPVRSTSAFAASSLDADCSTTGSVCAAAFTREYDNNCSGCEPVDPVEVGITVDQGAVPSLGYQSPSTSGLTANDVTFNYSVSPNGIAGNAIAEYVPLGSATSCATVTTDLSFASPEQNYAAGSTGTDYDSGSVTGLDPDTTYCWRVAYTPDQGGGPAVYGGWNEFTTPSGATPASLSYPYPPNSEPTVLGNYASASFYYDLTSNNNAGTAYVEYVPVSSNLTCPGTGTPVQNDSTNVAASPTGSVSVIATINTLPQGETLCWQAVFAPTGGGSDVYGGWNIVNTPEPTSPTVSYPSPSTSNVGFTGATFDWNVDSAYEPGSTYVEYGPAGSGGSCPGASTDQTGSTSIASGTSGTSAESASASDLSSGITYCWRADFVPTSGPVVYGAWNTFGTSYLHQLPTIGYQRPATSETATSVTVNYTIHPAGDTISSWVDEGLPSNGSCSSPTDVKQFDTVDFSPPDGVGVNESGTVSGLSLGTTYCVSASFQQGSTVHALSYETVKTSLILFHLVGAVAYASPSTTAITSTGATFNYDAAPNGNAGSSSVQLAADSSNGSCASLSGEHTVGSPVVFFSGGTGSHPESVSATGLSPSTTYCWRAVWTPTSGTVADGNWLAFTTAAGSGGSGHPGGPGGNKPAFKVLKVPGSVRGDSFSVGLEIADAGSSIGIVCELKGKGKHTTDVASVGVRGSRVKAGAVTIHLVLSRKGRKLLAKDHRLTIEVVITVQPAGGKATSVVRTVRLVAPKQHKH